MSHVGKAEVVQGDLGMEKSLPPGSPTDQELLVLMSNALTLKPLYCGDEKAEPKKMDAREKAEPKKKARAQSLPLAVASPLFTQ